MVIDVNVLTTGWTIAGVIASFLVAVVALGLGVSSFIQIKNLQKAEKRERLLNEIIQWAEDIIEFSMAGSVMSDKELELMISEFPNISEMFSIHKLENRVMVIASKGLYIDKVATTNFPDDLTLKEHIIKVRRNLLNHSKLLDLKIKSQLRHENSIGKHSERLYNAARELIEYAVKLIPTL